MRTFPSVFTRIKSTVTITPTSKQTKRKKHTTNKLCSITIAQRVNRWKMIQTSCATDAEAQGIKLMMEGTHDKRRKPIFSFGRRMGRKGDPRMHRAVSAKLADPNMSLFHALKAGGFNYIDDVDAKAIDEESVTLAQRKNQLSRRLRMAKIIEETHSQEGTSKKSPPTSEQTMVDLVEAQKATFQNLLRKSTEGSSIGSMDSHHHHFSVDQNVTATAQEKPHCATTFEPFNRYHHQLHHPHPRHSTAMNEQLNHRKGEAATIYPTMLRKSTGGLLDDEPDEKIPPTAFVPPKSVTLYRSNSTSGIPEPPRLTSRMSSRTVNDSQSGTALCTEFGLRSLHRTAQSVGLSLDQLALVLSSTENLAEKLDIDDATAM